MAGRTPGPAPAGVRMQRPKPASPCCPLIRMLLLYGSMMGGAPPAMGGGGQDGRAKVQRNHYEGEGEGEREVLVHLNHTAKWESIFIPFKAGEERHTLHCSKMLACGSCSHV